MRVFNKLKSNTFRAFVLCTFAVFFSSSSVDAIAQEIVVVSSGGFAQAYSELSVPYLNSHPELKIKFLKGPSMGETVNAIPKRLARGENIDVVIMVGSALDDLMDQGKLLKGSKVLLARSLIAAAVKSGTPKPDISSKEALKKALLDAKSIAYSDSASGEYLSKELFPSLGIAEQMKDKARKIPATPVGEIVASGQAELGFQQLSELLPVPGLEIVGKLSSDVQRETLFSGAVVASSTHVDAAKNLLAYLSSAQVQPIVIKTGLDSIPGR
jgi:molybdate transport system substrate-binding protein